MKLSINSALPRLVLIGGPLIAMLLLGGCSSGPKPSSPDEVKAFKGDPQKIAEGQAQSMNDRAKAEQQSKSMNR